MPNDDGISIQPIVLCGGHGSRLWPLSIERRPKPFLPLLSDRSILAETAGRVGGREGAVAFAPVAAVGSARHEELLKQELPNEVLVLEPVAGKSTAPVAAACLAAPAEGLVLLLPDDHHTTDVTAFRTAIAAGAAAASDGRIVTFGVRPDRPVTGCGYIEAAATLKENEAGPVRAFVEKPDAATAARYLASGRHLWNAGIFIAGAGTLLSEIERFAPDILKAVRAADCERGPLGAGEIRRPDPAAFAAVP